jgi:selenocysteine lyase/cysteine desulfurase
MIVADDAKLALLAREFPSAQKGIHFDHASVGPISLRVSDVMAAASHEYAARGFQNSWREDIEVVRQHVADLVGSAVGNIAYTQNTSTGLSVAANGLAWQPGDNVVVPEREFPSNYYPWINLEPRGVHVRRVPAPAGHASIEAIRDAIDDRTRVVTVSAVQFSNGFRYDLAAIGELCARRGVLFVVDGTQSVGALTIDVQQSQIDVLAVSSHKWMLGPSGIGFIHLSDRALDVIRPDIVGWLSVAEPFAFDYSLDLPRTADRYEPGTENVLGTLGLGAAISLFLECGTHWVEHRVLSLTDHLCDGLRSLGCSIISPRGGHSRSGIVIFAKPEVRSDDLHVRLSAAGIKCAVRGGGIRFSPHCYNTEDEISTALDAMQ